MPKSNDAASRGVSPTAEDFVLAKAALLDITAADTIGEPSGSITEADGALTVYFDTTMAGYPGWKWTVSLAHVEGFGPSVLETELTPGEGALLSPEWVPWSDRLADYKEAQAALAAESGADVDGPGGDGSAVDGADDDDDSDDEGDDEDDDFDDDDVNDDDDDDEDEDDDDDDEDDDDILHSGDLDGVDIDSLDDSGSGSALPAVSDDQSKKAESQSHDASPQPPVKSRSNQRAKKQQQHDKGE